MSGETPDARLAAVLGVRQDRRGMRSPLFLFMRQNFSILMADFEENGPCWEQRTKAFAEAGLTDRNGHPPTVKTAQYTWYQVKLHQAAVSKPRKAVASIPSPSPTATSSASEVAEDELERPGPRFSFAKPRT